MKVRHRIVYEQIVEIDPQAYIEEGQSLSDVTIEQVCRIDKAGLKDDPCFFLESATETITVEPVE